MNQERKEAYVEEKRKQTTLFANFELIMNLAAPLEEEYGRDICEWSENEIVRLYRYYSTTSYNHLVQLNCALINYTDWCLDNGLVRDGINHFRNVSTETLIGCLDKKKLYQTVMFRKEFLKEVKQLPNFRDQYLLLGLFEGIPTKYLDKIKLSDLTRDILSLPDGRKMTVSKELVNIMHLADEDDICVEMGDKYRDTFGYTSPTDIGRVAKSNFGYKDVYNAGPELLKDTVGNGRKVTTKTGTVLIGYRIRRCNAFLGTTWTIASVIESGRLQMIKDMAAQFGCSPEKIVRDKNLREIVETKFGKIPNIGSYWLIWQDLLNM